MLADFDFDRANDRDGVRRDIDGTTVEGKPFTAAVMPFREQKGSRNPHDNAGLLSAFDKSHIVIVPQRHRHGFLIPKAQGFRATPVRFYLTWLKFRFLIDRNQNEKSGN